MEKYFNLTYEFNREAVHTAIAERLCLDGSDYICVADGVVLDLANRRPAYLAAVNGGMFSICDSSYVPLYLRWLYGIDRKQYSGSRIFIDIVASRKYRMLFMGASHATLSGLQSELLKYNPDVASMTFMELPYRDVDDFDYAQIARDIQKDGADIIWIALGAPKQELFMARLKPHLSHGVMIAVGAAFKFYSSTARVKRAPAWMVKCHLEFVHRICSEPRKQLRRCRCIVQSLPRLLWREYRRKRQKAKATLST